MKVKTLSPRLRKWIKKRNDKQRDKKLFDSLMEYASKVEWIIHKPKTTNEPTHTKTR